MANAPLVSALLDSPPAARRMSTQRGNHHQRSLAQPGNFLRPRLGFPLEEASSLLVRGLSWKERPLPWRERPPKGKKKYAILWQCCKCNYSPISIHTNLCPTCASPRCQNCRTQKVIP